MSDEIYVPWNIVYDQTPLFNPREHEPRSIHFWGFKHNLTIRPGKYGNAKGYRSPPVMPERPTGLYLIWGTYNGVPRDPYPTLRQKQSDFLNSLKPRLTMQSVQDETEFKKLLKAAKELDIIYFFTHAKGGTLKKDIKDEQGNPDTILLPRREDAAIYLQDEDPVKKHYPLKGYELERLADEEKLVLQGYPFVFLNTCESGDVFTIAPDTFISGFLKLGAKGVLVTESVVWQGLADDLGRQFFNRFLDGQKTMGEILIDLRNLYLQLQNNPFGLLYTIYGDSALKVGPSTTREKTP